MASSNCYPLTNLSLLPHAKYSPPNPSPKGLYPAPSTPGSVPGLTGFGASSAQMQWLQLQLLRQQAAFPNYANPFLNPANMFLANLAQFRSASSFSPPNAAVCSPNSDGSPCAKRIRLSNVCPGCNATLEDSAAWQNHNCQLNQDVEMLINRIVDYRSHSAARSEQMGEPRADSAALFNHSYAEQKCRAEKLRNLKEKMYSRNGSAYTFGSNDSSPCSVKEAASTSRASSTAEYKHPRHIHNATPATYSCKQCHNSCTTWKVSSECNDMLCSSCWDTAVNSDQQQGTDKCFCPFCQRECDIASLIECQL